MKKDLIKKSEIDLEKDLNEKQLALRDLRFGIAGSKNKNVKQQMSLRKEIARIKTQINSVSKTSNK